MDPLGFNNTFAMVIRGEDARKNKIATLSDAARYSPGWNLGVGYEFQQRPDGLAGLLKTYHLPIHGSPKTMDLGLLYKALEQGQVSMVAGNATDGQLSVLDAVVLQDDQRYFPPYDCALVVRAEILKDNPPLRQALTELAGRFTDLTMRKLNYQVDGEHRPVREVAEQFLREAGSASLIGDQKVLGKRPFRIDPLRFAEESRTSSDDQESPRRGTCGRLPSRSFPLL